MNIIDMHRAARIIGAGRDSAEQFLAAKGVAPVGAEPIRGGFCRYYDKKKVETVAEEYETYMREVYRNRAAAAAASKARVKAAHAKEAPAPKAAPKAASKPHSTDYPRTPVERKSEAAKERDEALIAAYKGGETSYALLAKKFGISKARVYQILDKGDAVEQRRGEPRKATAVKKGGRKRSAERVARDEKIIEEYKAGATDKDLAAKYGMSPNGIWRIRVKMGAINVPGRKPQPSGELSLTKEESANIASKALKAAEISPSQFDQLTTLIRSVVVELKALGGRISDMHEELDMLKVPRGIRPAPLNPVIKPEIAPKVREVVHETAAAPAQ